MSSRLSLKQVTEKQSLSSSAVLNNDGPQTHQRSAEMAFQMLNGKKLAMTETPAPGTHPKAS